MKKQVLRYLLAIVGVVLLTGLIVSCGGDEAMFKIIASKEYTDETTFIRGMDELSANYVKTRQKLSDDQGKVIYNQYQDKIWELGKPEMGKMSSMAAGICVVMKVDQYLLLCNFYYNKGERWINNRTYYNY